MSDESVHPSLTDASFHDVVAMSSKAAMAYLKTVWPHTAGESLTYTLNVQKILPGISISFEQYVSLEDNLNRFLTSTLPNSSYPVSARAKTFDLPLQDETVVVISFRPCLLDHP